MPQSPKYFHFTVDVDYIRGSESGLPALFDICQKYDLKPTYMITGRFAEEYPEYIQEMVQRDYELGTHGWEHGTTTPDEDYSTASYETQLSWIGQSTDAVEKVAGYRPTIFRAPNLWVSSTTFRVLEELDYQIDSSVPSHRCDLGRGQVNSPRYYFASLSPYHPNPQKISAVGDSSVLEVAPSAFFIPMNMSALRNLGRRAVNWGGATDSLQVVRA